MFVKTSNPVKNNKPSKIGCSSIEIVRLTPKWRGGLSQFLQDLAESKDDFFFAPHATDENTINHLVNYVGKDLYYLIVEEENVLGYGLLRGWDEGYEIPSLGIAIHPSTRGKGLGKMFMNFLHVVAVCKGANRARLRVHQNNDNAIGLYKSIGYIFEKDTAQGDYLVGFVRLCEEHTK